MRTDVRMQIDDFFFFSGLFSCMLVAVGRLVLARRLPPRVLLLCVLGLRPLAPTVTVRSTTFR